MYANWIKMVANFANVDELECPNCGQKSIDYLYVVDEQTKVGYLQIWCNHCFKGIYVSRVEVSTDEKKVLLFQEKEQVDKLVPRYELIY